MKLINWLTLTATYFLIQTAAQAQTSNVESDSTANSMNNLQHRIDSVTGVNNFLSAERQENIKALQKFDVFSEEYAGLIDQWHENGKISNKEYEIYKIGYGKNSKNLVKRANNKVKEAMRALELAKAGTNVELSFFENEIIYNLQDKNDSLSTVIGKQNNTIEKLNAQDQDQNSDVQAIQAENYAYEKEKALIEAQYGEAQRIIKEYEKEVQIYKNTSDPQLVKQIEILRADNKTRISQIEGLNNKINNQKNKFLVLESEHTEEVVDLRGQVSDLSKINESKENIRYANKDVKITERERADEYIAVLIPHSTETPESLEINAKDVFPNSKIISFTEADTEPSRNIEYAKNKSIDANAIFDLDNSQNPKELVEFTEKIKAELLDDKYRLIVGLHTNHRGMQDSLTIQPEHIAESYTNPEMSKTLFAYTNSSKLFDILKSNNVNVILQKNDMSLDDGSASFFATKNGVSYLNIEAGANNEEEMQWQKSILEALYSDIKKDPSILNFNENVIGLENILVAEEQNVALPDSIHNPFTGQIYGPEVAPALIKALGDNLNAYMTATVSINGQTAPLAEAQTFLDLYDKAVTKEFTNLDTKILGLEQEVTNLKNLASKGTDDTLVVQYNTILAELNDFKAMKVEFNGKETNILEAQNMLNQVGLYADGLKAQIDVLDKQLSNKASQESEFASYQQLETANKQLDAAKRINKTLKDQNWNMKTSVDSIAEVNKNLQAKLTMLKTDVSNETLLAQIDNLKQKIVNLSAEKRNVINYSNNVIEANNPETRDSLWQVKFNTMTKNYDNEIAVKNQTIANLKKSNAVSSNVAVSPANSNVIVEYQNGVQGLMTFSTNKSINDLVNALDGAWKTTKGARDSLQIIVYNQEKSINDLNSKVQSQNGQIANKNSYISNLESENIKHTEVVQISGKTDEVVKTDNKNVPEAPDYIKKILGNGKYSVLPAKNAANGKEVKFYMHQSTWKNIRSAVEAKYDMSSMSVDEAKIIICNVFNHLDLNKDLVITNDEAANVEYKF